MKSRLTNASKVALCRQAAARPRPWSLILPGDIFHNSETQSNKMRLLDVKTYKLVDATGMSESELRYATLSHTWTKDEVTFEDIQNLSIAREKRGWHKIRETCRLAFERAIFYVWIDTCCIDKSSSAELSEAINSMFAWYRDCLMCFVHLEDMDPESTSLEQSLPSCRWFSRGWTLQELIAPERIYFFNNQWERIGTKSRMAHLLHKITRIDEDALMKPGILSTIPVGRRMSWAANRNTTRPEDMAYCLFGLFDVNMPLLYGEGGEKAFLRLQEVITLATSDLSLFAWKSDMRQARQDISGIFSPSPRFFADCNQIDNIDDPLESDSRLFTTVNRSISFQSCLRVDMEEGEYQMRLCCRHPGARDGCTMAIRLIKTPGGFVRHRTDTLPYIRDSHSITSIDSWDPTPRTVTIPKSLSYADMIKIDNRFDDAFEFQVSNPNVTDTVILSPSLPEQVGATMETSHFDASTDTYMTEGHPRFTGTITCAMYDDPRIDDPDLYVPVYEKTGHFLVFFGFDGHYAADSARRGLKPWLAICPINAAELSRGDARESPDVYNLPQGILLRRHSLDYLRFSSYVGCFYRLQLGLADGKPFRRQMLYIHRGREIRISASLATRRNKLQGTVHVVTINIESTSDSERLREPRPRRMPLRDFEPARDRRRSFDLQYRPRVHPREGSRERQYHERRREPS